MTDQRQLGIGVGLAQLADKIRDIIIKLTDMGDVPSRSRSRMAANIDGNRNLSIVGERARHHVHFVRRGRGSMCEDSNPIARTIVSGIKAIGERSAIARVKTAEFRLPLATNRPRAGIDGSKGW